MKLNLTKKQRREVGILMESAQSDLEQALASLVWYRDHWLYARDRYKHDLDELLEKFQHRHVRSEHHDICKQCGFDLRHPIHERLKLEEKGKG